MKKAGLEALFDFQRFWKNTHLEVLAEESMKRYCLEILDKKQPGEELPDDSLAFVSAAGEPETMGFSVSLFREEDGGDG